MSDPAPTPSPEEIEAESRRILDEGLEAAKAAWLEAIKQGLRDPVVTLTRAGTPDDPEIHGQAGERESLVDFLAGSHPEAAECLGRDDDPGCPMTVVVEYAGVLSIIDLPDPRAEPDSSGQ